MSNTIDLENALMKLHNDLDLSACDKQEIISYIEDLEVKLYKILDDSGLTLEDLDFE
jgi:hypothetical protein